MRIKLIDLLKKQGIEIGMKGCYSAKDAYEWIMQQEVDIPEALDEEEIIKLLQGAYLDFTGMSINHDLCSRMARYVCQKFCAPEKEGLDNSIKPCDHVFSPETTKFSYQSCIKQGCNAVIFSKPSLKLPEKNNLDEALKELECDSVELNQMIGWNKAIEEVKRLNKQ